MANVTREARVPSAYNFKRENQESIMHIVKLSIGGVVINEDQELTDPEQPDGQSKLPVVAAGDYYFWDSGEVRPMEFQFYSSIPNQVLIKNLIMREMPNIDVEIVFAHYEYDRVNGCFYKNAHSNEVAWEGRIQTEGGNRALNIGDQPTPVLENRDVYRVNLSIVPDEKVQYVHLANSLTDKYTKIWGVQGASEKAS